MYLNFRNNGKVITFTYINYLELLHHSYFFIGCLLFVRIRSNIYTAFTMTAALSIHQMIHFELAAFLLVAQQFVVQADTLEGGWSMWTLTPSEFYAQYYAQILTENWPWPWALARMVVIHLRKLQNKSMNLGSNLVPPESQPTISLYHGTNILMPLSLTDLLRSSHDYCRLVCLGIIISKCKASKHTELGWCQSLWTINENASGIKGGWEEKNYDDYGSIIIIIISII